ncbi:MAG TPA: AAA family ATPase, partial [Thiobacillaceae bacterium]|nr:AAA family ATPase [Thiobacillaceae bacterium]
YDESGRLRFNAVVEDAVTDAKGAAQALRLGATRQRRYGRRHIAARVGQIDELIARIAGYAAEVAAQRADLGTYAAQSLWLDPAFAERAEASLAATAAALAQLADRARLARSGFEALPRLAEDGAVPEPVAHEALIP